MLTQTAKQERSVRKCQRRKGAILSVEWLVVFPILVAVMFAVFEFSLLWSARQLLEAATYAAAREASLPAADEASRMAAAIQAAESILANPKYLGDDPDFDGYSIDTFDVGVNTGDPITVSLSLPMTTAAPDLLKVVGISIEGKLLTASTVIRRE